MSIKNHNVLSKPFHDEEGGENVRRVHYLSGYRLMRLPRKDQTVEVLMGTAWLTMDGEDYILQTGDMLQLTSGGDFALVSSLQQKRLVLAVSQ
jgi:quercetin dioxygenase-like cupin family protein